MTGARAHRRRSLVALLVVWLAVNFEKTPALFIKAFLIGITNGSVYALVALGYTLVYGILELINFAHGDVFMLGGMMSATFLISVFHLDTGASAGSLWPALFASLAISMLFCGVAQRVDRARRVPAAAERASTRAADHGDRDVVHPPERRPSPGRAPNYVSLPIDILPHGVVFTIGGNTYTWDALIVVLLTVPVLIALVWLVQYTKQGKAMRATAQDREAAAMMGIDVNRTISFTFLIAGGLAGVSRV